MVVAVATTCILERDLVTLHLVHLEQTGGEVKMKKICTPSYNYSIIILPVDLIFTTLLSFSWKNVFFKRIISYYYQRATALTPSLACLF